jgi:hypothetical protein
MKNLHLVFSIVIFLALVCSPAIAISKSDLISQYKIGQFWPTSIPVQDAPSEGGVPAYLCGSCDIPPGYAWIGGKLLPQPTPTPIPTLVPISDLGDLTGKPIFLSVPSDKQSFLNQVNRGGMIIKCC